VAERLGEGFSAEEQLTGKAEFGGLQIIAYPMKAERYLDILRAREEAERAREAEARARGRRRRIERLRELLSPFSDFSDRARSVAAASMATLAEIEHSVRGAGEVSPTGDVPDPDRVEAELRRLFDRWNSQVAELARLSPKAFSTSEEMYSMASMDDMDSPRYSDGGNVRKGYLRLFGAEQSGRTSYMGLGGGGRMRQEVFADLYGVDAWDQSAGNRCFVHLVDAMQWAEISGGPPPTEPPSQKDYQKMGLPWFDYYAPEKGAISGSKLLAGLKSWGSMYGKRPGAAMGKSGTAIQLGTAQRPSGVVSEGAGDE
jgi:hypothetical protein